MPTGNATDEGRREERFDASWLIVIALPGGREIRSSAKDVSVSGARLAIPAHVDLPETFAFKVLGKNFVVQARIAWRRGDYVGVTVVRTARLPEPVAKPDTGRDDRGPTRTGTVALRSDRGAALLAGRR